MALSLDFGSVSLTGLNAVNPTSIQFGPDGRLYVSQQDGTIKVANVQAVTDATGAVTSYEAFNVETINLVKEIPNHNDDGTLNTSLSERQSTGLVVEEGSNGEVVIYIGSSDPRIGGGNKGEQNLDTNSGIISRLVQQPDGSWEKVDLVIGLPRSEENHSTNGLDIRTEIVDGELHKIMYVASGGNTNNGSPGNNFEWIPEYYYSAGILRIDLTQLEQMEADLLANGGLKGGTNYVDPYVYALPTLDDPTRTNNANGQDTVAGVTNAAEAEAADTFGGNDGLNMAKYDPDGPVQVYSMGYRNAYDLVLTEEGNLYTFDNGPNNGWGNKPITADGVSVTSSDQVASNNPNVDVADGNDTDPDNLHLVTPGFYGGHPNPTYASGPDAGLYAVDDSSGTPVIVQLTDPSDPNNDPNTTADDLPADWNTVSGIDPATGESIVYPETGVYQDPGSNASGNNKGEDGSLLTIGSSTNGLTEYTAAVEGGVTDLLGAEVLISASFNGNLTFAEIVSDGSQGGTSVTDVQTISVGGTPLDVTAVGTAGVAGQDPQLFAGTIWVAQYGSDTITVMVPGLPPVADTDKDNDGIDDNLDPLQDDALNGAMAVLDPGGRLFWDFNPAGSGIHPEPSGEYDIGMTGWMINGVDDLDGLRNLDNTIRGGAPGIIQIKSVGTGDFAGTANSQQDAMQTGFTVGTGVDKFTIRVPILNPFSSDANNTVGWSDQASMGIVLGDGTQSNALQIAVTPGDPTSGPLTPQIRVTYEENDVVLTSFAIDAPALAPANGTIDDDQIDLMLMVDMQTLQVTPAWRYQSAGVWSSLQVMNQSVQLQSGGAIAQALQGQYTINGQPSSPTVALTATASGYDAFTADFLDLTIATPAVLFLPTDTTTEVTEGDSTGDSYYVVLSTPPVSDVTVTLAAGNDVTLDTTQLVFTADNWDVPQLVNVVAVDDALNEGEENLAITHTLSSTDADFDGLSKSFTVTVFDNDVPGITLGVSGGTTSVTEGGATDSYTLVLDSQPTEDVTITLTPNAQVTLDKTAVVFTPGNWNVAQTVTITAVDDTATEGTQTVAISHTVSSADANYDGQTVDDLGVTIVDNDQPAILYRVNVGGGEVAAADGGPAWSADTQATPSAYLLTSENKFYSTTQSVDLSSPTLPGEGEVSTLFQTTRHDGFFDPNMTWGFDVAPNTDVEVRLYFAEWWKSTEGSRVFDVAVEGAVPTAFDNIDLVAIGGEWKKGLMLSHTTTVTDGTLNLDFLNNVSNSWVSAIEILQAGAAEPVVPELSINDVTVNEADGTATFTVSLSEASASEVTVNAYTSDGTALAGSDYTAVSPTTLTFAPGVTSQSFTVDILDDSGQEASEAFNVTLDTAVNATIADGVGVGTINDDDTPGVILTESDGLTEVGEGGPTDTYAIKLVAQPSADVTVTLTPSNQLTLDTNTLVFTPDNWDVAQTVTITAVDDTATEGTQTVAISHAVSSTDAGYDGLAVDDLGVTVIDNDQPASSILYRVNVGGGELAAADGGPAWSADTQATPSAYLLTSENKFYSTTQSVDLSSPTLPGEGEVSTLFQTTRHDGFFDPNMTWGFDVAPNTDVEVRLYFAEWWKSTEGSRVFDVAVEGAVPTAFDNIDLVAIGGEWKKGLMLSHTTTVTDGTLNLDFLNNVSNSWVSAIEILQAGAAEPVVPELSINDVTVNEADGTATFTVSLSEASASEVTVNAYTSDGTALAGSDYTAVSPTTLTFAPGVTSQSFTVDILDDSGQEASEAFNVTLDTAVNATIADGVGVGTINDDDTPGVTLAESGGSTLVEEGGVTDTYTLVLDSQPTADVTITLTPDAQLTLDQTTLVFTPDNWDVAQTVTLTAVDDTDIEGTQAYTINHTVSSTDTDYDGLGLDALGVTIVDNDELPVGAVLHRINVGGASVTASDGSVWSADTNTAPSSYRVGTGGSNIATFNGIISLTDPSLGESAQVASIFQTERWDPITGENMKWAFDSLASGNYEVRLYFAETYDPAQTVGGRMFDVAVEGIVPTVFDDIDPFAIAGADTGFMLDYQTTVSDGTLNLEFLHGVQNPSLKGIEIFSLGTTDPIDTTPPVVEQSVAEVILTEKSTPQVISVIYSDSGSGLALTSFDANDITVTGDISGVQAIVASPTVTDNGDGTVTVDYEIAPPGGTWDAAENDTYTIALNANEVFDLAGNAAVADASVNTFVIDIPPSTTNPDVSIDDVSINEGDGTATFTVSLSASSAAEVTVDYATADGTALSGSDYTATSGTLTFAAGETSQTVTVDILDDAIEEASETFTVDLSNVSGGTILDGSGTATILANDSPVPNLTVNDITVNEGDGTATFTVSLSEASSSSVAVDFTTVDGTALAGSDYTTNSGTLTFAAGETSKTITVSLSNDKLAEADEAFSVQLSNASGANLADGSGTATVNDNDSLDYLFNSITPVDSVDANQNGSVKVSVTLSDNVQISGYGTDKIAVENTGDKRVAAIYFDITDALFQDTVFDPQGLAGDSVARGIAFSNTGSSGVNQPVFNKNNPAVTEPFYGLGGVAGYEGAFLTFDTTVNNGFENGEQIIFGVDVDPNSITGLPQNPVDINGDDPRLQVNGTGWDIGGVSGAELIGSKIHVLFTDGTTATGELASNGQQGGAIAVIDQASPNKTASLTVNGLTDGGVGTYNQTNFQVLVSGNVGDTVRVSLVKGFVQPFAYTAPNGNSIDLSTKFTDADFVANNAIEVQTVDVTLTSTEQDITSLFDLTAPGGIIPAFPSDDQLPLGLTATVIDSTSELPLGEVSAPIYLEYNALALLPELSVNDVSVDESAGTATFAVTLSAASTTDVTVDFTTADGTALAGSDYTTTSGTLTFLAGETSQTITVDIIDDPDVEVAEAFTVELSNANGADIVDGSGTATIAASDGENTATILASQPNASESGTNGQFTVNLSQAVTTDTVIAYTVGGTAHADGNDIPGEDYVELTGQVTIAAGTSSATIDVTVLDDAYDEAATESVNVTLTGAVSGDTNVVLGTSTTATVTIADDDLTTSSASGLIPTEIMYDPNSEFNGDYSWIELYNPGSTAVDLSNYVIFSPKAIQSSGRRAGVISEGSIVEAGSTIVLYGSVVRDPKNDWGTNGLQPFAPMWESTPGELNLQPVFSYEAIINHSPYLPLNLGGTADGTIELYLWNPNDYSLEGEYWNDPVDYSTAELSIYAEKGGEVAGSVFPTSNNSSSIYLKDVNLDPTDGNNWALSVPGLDGAYAADANIRPNNNPPNVPGPYGSVDVASPGYVPGTTGAIRREAETADNLINYRVENNTMGSGGQIVGLGGTLENETGTATFTLGAQVNGTYDILLSGFDENDGIARYQVEHYDVETGVTTAFPEVQMNADLGSADPSYMTAVVLEVATSFGITPGDQLIVTGLEDAGDTASIDYIELIPAV